MKVWVASFLPYVAIKRFYVLSRIFLVSFRLFFICSSASAAFAMYTLIMFSGTKGGGIDRIKLCLTYKPDIQNLYGSHACMPSVSTFECSSEIVGTYRFCDIILDRHGMRPKICALNNQFFYKISLYYVVKGDKQYCIPTSITFCVDMCVCMYVWLSINIKFQCIGV